jgi:hypothetical protein
MTDTPFWGWYASADEENYTCGPEATRDAIIQAATSDEIGLYNLDDPQVFHIIEAWQANVDLADHFDAVDWVDGINDDLSDFGGEDGEPIVDLTAVATSSLERTVRDAITKWQADNNLRFRHWQFSGTRNGEIITIPVPNGDTLK